MAGNVKRPYLYKHNRETLIAKLQLHQMEPKHREREADELSCIM